ncbi:MAG: DUF2063 domain-containing protein [Alphaproteobacteria bacterium PA4]|nr:MAG: DUF2063 domain-containing protein [Alphaproteobacteria bacterium PA4]
MRTPLKSFSIAVRTPDGVQPMFVSAAGGRFAIYQRNHVSSLVAALARTFPVVKRLVGDDFFAAMAARFVLQAPPRSRIIAEYGGDFAAFVAAFEPAETLPYLADVARLEHARVAAFHAADHEGFDLDGEGAIAAALTRRIALHPSATLLASPHPVLGLWQANQRETPGAVARWAPETLIIHRDGDAIAHSPLDDFAAEFVTTLLTADSLEAALLTLAEPELAGAALLLVVRLVRDGALVVAPPDPTPEHF